MRNVVAHRYGRVDPGIVWNSLNKNARVVADPS